MFNISVNIEEKCIIRLEFDCVIVSTKLQAFNLSYLICFKIKLKFIYKNFKKILWNFSKN